MNKLHRIIIAILLSILAWQIANQLIVEITFWQFILVEILIAAFELFSIFVKNKAEGKPTTFFIKNEAIQPDKTGED